MLTSYSLGSKGWGKIVLITSFKGVPSVLTSITRPQLHFLMIQWLGDQAFSLCPSGGHFSKTQHRGAATETTNRALPEERRHISVAAERSLQSRSWWRAASYKLAAWDTLWSSRRPAALPPPPGASKGISSGVAFPWFQYLGHKKIESELVNAPSLQAEVEWSRDRMS